MKLSLALRSQGQVNSRMLGAEGCIRSVYSKHKLSLKHSQNISRYLTFMQYDIVRIKTDSLSPVPYLPLDHLNTRTKRPCLRSIKTDRNYVLLPRPFSGSLQSE